MEVRPRRVLKYVTEGGRCPFDDWFDSLKDKRSQAIVATRVNRIVQGNFGQCRKLEDGIWEFKIDYGPGYRVYFAEDGDTVVLLLCGGDKSTQPKDIVRARECWSDYHRSE